MTKIIVHGEIMLNDINCYTWQEFYNKCFGSQSIQFELGTGGKSNVRKLINNFEIGIPDDGKTYYVDMVIRLTEDGSIELTKYQWNENPFKLNELNERKVLRMISADLKYTADDTTKPTSFVFGHNTGKATYALNNAIGNVMTACSRILEDGKRYIPAIEEFTNGIKKTYEEDKDLENFNMRSLILSNQEIIQQKVNDDWSNVVKVMNQYVIAANVVLALAKFAKYEKEDFYFTYDAFLDKLVKLSDAVDLFPNAEIRLEDIDCSDMIDNFISNYRIDVSNVLNYVVGKIQVHVSPMDKDDVQKITSILNENRELYDMAEVRIMVDVLFGARPLYPSFEFINATSPIAIFRFAELKEQAK